MNPQDDNRWDRLEKTPLKLAEQVDNPGAPHPSEPTAALFGKPIHDPKVAEVVKSIRTDQHIDGLNIRLYYWSRDLRILTAVAVILLLAAAGIAWTVQNPTPPTKAELENSVTYSSLEVAPNEDLMSLLQTMAPDPWQIYSAMIAGLDGFDRGQRLQVVDAINRSNLGPGDKQVATAFWNSLVSEYPDPNATLLYLAHQAVPPRHANRLVAEFYLFEQLWRRALHYVEREGRYHPSEPITNLRLELLLKLGDDAQVEKVLSETRSEENESGPARAGLELKEAVNSGSLARTFHSLMRYEASTFNVLNLGLAGIAGMVWYLICAQAIQPRRIISSRFLVPPFAVIAGALSTLPTLIGSIWMETAFNLRLGETIPGDLLYFIVGVGVREEVLKLTLFLPFIPLLLFRKDRLAMLMVAGFVGLGFAVWENMAYFERGGPVAAYQRLLTANFFHISSTALIGLAFCDFLLSPIKKLLPFVGVTLLVMFVHGVYDAFIAIPELQMLSIVSIVSFLLLSLFFFRRLKSLRDGMTDQISMAATLILGLAVLTACVFVVASKQMGFANAAASLVLSAFGLLMISYLFYWQLGEGMSPGEEETAC